MTKLPPEIDAGDIHCVKGDERDPTYYCIPGSPKPELAPDGRPTLGLWMIPPQPTLQLGSRWTLDPDDIAAVRTALAARVPNLDPDSVQIMSAPVTVEEAVVLIDDGAGRLDELASSSTSGFPPYMAIFSARLNDSQAALVASALSGAPGRLLVEYRARLDQGLRFAADAASPALARRVDISTWFDRGTGAAGIHVMPTQQPTS